MMLVKFLTVCLAIGAWLGIGITLGEFLCWCFEWECTTKATVGVWVCVSLCYSAMRSLRRGG